LEAYFDGHLQGPGIWKWRHYFEIYDRHLARFRGARPRLVEIGIYSGGSLEMWHDYFGSGAEVCGIDIEPACKAYESAGTRVFIGDQDDRTFLDAFLTEVPAFDVVIDDGGHLADQQIATFEALFPHVRPGGVFVCEDIHGRGHATHAFFDGVARELHVIRGDTSGFPTTAWQSSVASVHIYAFVTVIEKRAAPLASLEAPKHGTQWEPFYD